MALWMYSKIISVKKNVFTLMCFQATAASQMYFWSFLSTSMALSENRGFHWTPVIMNVPGFVWTYPCTGGAALGRGLSSEAGLDDDGSDTDLA